MSDYFHRTAKIFNGCPELIRLRVLANPGRFLVKEIKIRSDDYKYMSYGTVDSSYNKYRWKEIEIVVGENENERIMKAEEEDEQITPNEIRDSTTIILSMKDNGHVRVQKFGGRLIGRIGLAWKLKEFFGKIKSLKKKKKKAKKPMEKMHRD